VIRPLIVVLLPVAVAAALMSSLSRTSELVDSGHMEASAIAWGDRVFTTRAQLEAWLRSHGAIYRAWLTRHPGAAPWEPRRRASSTATERAESAAPVRAVAATGGSSEGAPVAAPAVEFPEPGSAWQRRIVLGLVLALALTLLAASAMPPRWYALRMHRVAALRRRRVETAALGAALLLGVALPLLA
jgi:hypothetical protein